MNEIIEACGTFPLASANLLLNELEFYQNSRIFIKLIFRTSSAILSIVSAILLYSLIKMNAEKQILNTTLLRVVGVTSDNHLAIALA